MAAQIRSASMSRSGSLASDWFHLGRVRSIGEISSALDALTPESVSDYAASTTLSRGDSYLGQWQSPAIAADAKGNTGHASLTLAVQPGPALLP